MTRAQLSAIGGRIRTLAAAMQCGFALVEVVTQDGYTHDVVFAAGAHWIVFDTT